MGILSEKHINELELGVNAQVNIQMFIKYWESADMRPLCKTLRYQRIENFEKENVYHLRLILHPYKSWELPAPSRVGLIWNAALPKLPL